MDDLRRLNDLCTDGRMHWIAGERAWSAEPTDVLRALADEGFQEYKQETTRSRRDRVPSGGVWQGIDNRTGTVASAIWVRRMDASPLVFIDFDGEPFEGR
jgi:hypothetical protein